MISSTVLKPAMEKIATELQNMDDDKIMKLSDRFSKVMEKVMKKAKYIYKCRKATTGLPWSSVNLLLFLVSPFIPCVFLILIERAAKFEAFKKA